MNNNYTDKELEKIFQEGLNKPDIPFKEDAWTSMEVLLNNKKRRKRRFFIWLFFGVLAISSLVIAGNYLSHKDHSLLTDIGKDNKTDQELSSMSLESHIAETPIDEKTIKSINDNTEVILNNSEQENQLHNSQDVIEDHYQSDSGSPNSFNEVEEEKEGTEEENLVNNIFTPIKEMIQTAEDVYINVDELESREIPRLDYNSVLLEKLDGKKKIILVENESSGMWKAAFYVGPEWSSTPSVSFGNMDWSFDLMITRMVGSKIGIYTGVGYISDTYQAGKYDYKPERGFWTRSIAPDRTNARCRILDFPIGIQYHLSGTKRSGIVISAGFTSQYMLREAYYYKYENEEPDLVKNWMGNGESFHWLSGTQISVMYRLNVGKGLAIGVNPYFNIPIKGIGHGNIKISTMGMRTGIIF